MSTGCKKRRSRVGAGAPANEHEFHKEKGLLSLPQRRSGTGQLTLYVLRNKQVQLSHPWTRGWCLLFCDGATPERGG